MAYGDLNLNGQLCCDMNRTEFSKMDKKMFLEFVFFYSFTFVVIMFFFSLIFYDPCCAC